MKIVKLEKDKIKVILSESDLENMNINMHSLSPESPELSPFLCEVMDAVKAKTGFSPNDGQVIVEATLSDDGIILMLSKPNDEKTEIKPSSFPRRSECAVFEFLTPDHLLEMIRNVPPVYLLAMRLYSYNDKFYLSIPKRRIPILIYEYSFKSRISPIAESILAEYGKLLAGGYRLLCINTSIKKIN